MSAEEEPLSGGNVGSVVRVGDTVRRATGPWMHAVHELLRHLEDVGFEWSPRVHGVDEQGREVLDYIDGETVGATHPWPEWAWAEDTLVQAARVLREYHDAVRDFRPTGVRTWRLVTSAMDADDVVCHNDLAPYNVVYREGRIVGVIDWDLAAPARPAWDIAFSAWAFAPIHTPDHAVELGAPTDVARRIRLLTDTYRLDEREDFLGLVEQRMEASITGMESQAAAGEPAFRRMVADGHSQRIRDDRAYLAANTSAWRAAIGL